MMGNKHAREIGWYHLLIPSMSWPEKEADLIHVIAVTQAYP